MQPSDDRAKELTGYPSIDRPWLKYYTQEAIDTPLPKCTIYDYLWESNKADLDNTALNYFDRRISFRELFEGVDRCAKAFYAIGLRAGDIIVMSTVTTPEAIYAFYACNLLGVIPNMVDPRTSAEGICDYLNETSSRCVVTIDVACPKIAQAIEGTPVEHVIAISPADSLPPVKRTAFRIAGRLRGTLPALPDGFNTWQSFIARGDGTSCEPVPYEPDSCCVIVHTGGTTGTPKGVMLTNDNLNAMALQYRLLGAEFNSGQSFLNIMPPFIAYGVVCGIHMPLALGLTDVLIPQLDPDEFAGFVRKYKPAHMLGVPTHFEKMRTDPSMRGFDLGFFESAGAGGDSITAQFERDINDFLREHGSRYAIAKGYGMTEISSAAVACHGEVNRFQSAGVPHLKTIVSVFEPGTERELSYGETGEVCMSAPTVMLGYYGLPEETERILRRHSDGRLWIHSGDIGHMDEDGFLFIDGRIKRMIVRFDGFKVFPSLIENVVSSHPAVEQCCAVGVADAEYGQGQLPSVHVVLKSGYAGSRSRVQDELIELCHQELPEYAKPVEWHFRESLPLTPIGKVDYQALEKEAAR